MSALLELFKTSSALYGGNAAFVEDLYEHYLQDPESVDPAWRRRFDEIHREAANETAHGPVRENFERLAREPTAPRAPKIAGLGAADAERQAAVLRLINAYRYRGHQAADLDPLRLRESAEVADLKPEFHRFTEADMDRMFNTGSLYAPDRMSLREIIALCREVYCGHAGFEYMHITDTRQKRWIQKRVEGYRARPEITKKGKHWLLTLLTAAEGMEKYLHTRYVGQKRFSLEGGEALIPLMDELVQRAGRLEVEEIVIGMAHRGRLNVLTNILGKPPAEIFNEFEGRIDIESHRMSGDVKYHMGFSTDVDTDGGIVHLALGFNPSHLAIISPVIEGSVRARQHRHKDRTGSKVLPLLIHGDSAFAGQGVIMETLQLSQTRGFGTGGTVHVVVNNQIGFTTSNPLDTRSTLYCTDVGKMVQTPIFHVNGDDPEAVIFITRLALDFRTAFHKDVIIDLVCYRRHGHNEADEPAVTQPVMYKKIRRHPTARELYAERLVAEGLISPDQGRAMVESYRGSIEQGVVEACPGLCALKNPYKVDWSRFRNVDWDHPADTRLPKPVLTDLGLRLAKLPEGFELHPRVAKIWTERRKMALGDQMTDWGFAENLAYATLLHQRYPIRLSGQDSGRGTFFHRHAVVHEQNSGETYIPLQHLAADQPHFVVIDSILSEEAVLGFEYGYATAEPDTLCIWEAQFGDFANVAQVVIDQFISSAGTKWGLFCGLTMLLPHGYEGQGAEHSSARLERFLQLCAENNIQVCNCTTPAQVYHLLRRQMIRPFRKPLVVMSPKSLLRHRLATSSLDELAEGYFRPVICEVDPLETERVIRVVVCTGRVYYDLLEARRARGLDNVAIVRIEQLYPYPKEEFVASLTRFDKADEILWCQEEPQNQGAWDQIKHRFHALLEDGGKRLYYVGRPSSAAPAVGSHRVHVKQQDQLVDEALSGRVDPNMNRRMPCR
jgi:2-oxoglutarate dehydrogenase E1 component